MTDKKVRFDREAYIAELEQRIADDAKRLETLAAKEEHFHRTLENLREAFLFYRHDTEGRFTYVSPSYANILGYQPEEYLDLKVDDLWTSHPINEEAARRTRLSIQGLRQPPYEMEIYHKSGARRRFMTIETPIFDASGRVVAVEGTSRDITEKRKTEERLEKYRKNLEALIEQRTAELETSRKQLLDIINFLPDPTYVIDARRVIIAWNRAMVEMTGIEAATVLQKPYKSYLDDLFPAEQPHLIEQVIERSPTDADISKTGVNPAPWGQNRKRNKTALFGERYCPRFQGGKGGYFWATAAPILDTKGRVIGAIESLREVTGIKKAEEKLRSENLLLRATITDRYRFGDIIGNCRAMHDVYDLILKAATSDEIVLVQGESGTGKELVAKAIHSSSPRKDHPFIVVNCGAIPENLIESEFFGTRKGAFTDAHQDKKGFLQAAENGTLFLDEIGEISPALQVKLLRAIEGGGFSPVGDRCVIQPDVRFIAATNRDLVKMVNEGGIRSDFYYRIHVIPIHLPPLRERGDDLFLLVDHFLKQLSDVHGLRSLTTEELAVLRNHDWPGNVRELQNVLRRYVAFDTLIVAGATPSRAISDGNDAETPGDTALQPLKTALATFEKNFILNVLNQNRWHKTRSARVMALSRKTLFRKMKQHGLLEPQNGS